VILYVPFNEKYGIPEYGVLKYSVIIHDLNAEIAVIYSLLDRMSN